MLARGQQSATPEVAVSPRPGRRAAPTARPAWLDPRLALVAALGLVLVWQVAVPLAFLVFSSFKAVAPGRAGYWSWSFTLDNYLRAFSSGDLLTASLNSALFAGPSALAAFALGTYLAWLTQHTNVPAKGTFYVLALGQVVLPGVLST